MGVRVCIRLYTYFGCVHDARVHVWACVYMYVFMLEVLHLVFYKYATANNIENERKPSTFFVFVGLSWFAVVNTTTHYNTHTRPGACGLHIFPKLFVLFANSPFAHYSVCLLEHTR